MSKTLSLRAVVKMCQQGRSAKARKMLIDLLSDSSSRSVAEQKSLLDGLSYLELYDGRAKEALEALRRRQALGYRTVGERMDAILERCTLLCRLSRPTEAMAELTELLQDRRSLAWHGLLSALALYFELDDKCRELMGPILAEASGTALKTLGIPTATVSSAAEVAQAVKDAQRMYSSDSKAYSELLCRVFTEATQDGRTRVISDLREFSERATVALFKNQAREALNKLMSEKR